MVAKATEKGFLSGMKEIAAYVRRSEATVLTWIRELGLPAKKIGGQWESNTELIDRWKIKMIKEGIDI